MVTAALVLVITLYNHTAKRVPVLGAACMGLCRGLSFLVGASLLGWGGISGPAVVVGVLLLTVFIAWVTHIAADETHDTYRLGSVRWGPGVSLGGCYILIYFAVPSIPGPWLALSICFSLAATGWEFYCGGILKPDTPAPVVQRTIGRFLRGLLLIQASFVALVGFPMGVTALLFLVAWPISQNLAKRFYAS